MDASGVFQREGLVLFRTRRTFAVHCWSARHVLQHELPHSKRCLPSRRFCGSSATILWPTILVFCHKRTCENSHQQYARLLNFDKNEGRTTSLTRTRGCKFWDVTDMEPGEMTKRAAAMTWEGTQLNVTLRGIRTRVSGTITSECGFPDNICRVCYFALKFPYRKSIRKVAHKGTWIFGSLSEGTFAALKHSWHGFISTPHVSSNTQRRKENASWDSILTEPTGSVARRR